VSADIQTVESALPPKAVRRVWEPVLKRILASSFHGLMSNNLMLIHVNGRKTGKRYTLPVPYSQEGNTLIVMAAGVWWKNLRGGAPVRVRLRGKDYDGYAEVYEDREIITTEVRKFLSQRPEVARFLKVQLDANGQPDAEGLKRAASLRVVVRIQLLSTIV
jgi:hypothetical protein